ncbi:MAG: DUF1800 family protein [Burkholderiales bacterium]|nr:DUF1800 family protein [Opitutaceae bacterium]
MLLLRLRRAVYLCSIPVLSVAARAALDTNSNQLSDVWEAVHGASGLVAAGDPDGDGVSNAQEAIAGTDPLDPFSQPRLELTGNGALLTPAWSGFAGKRYQLLAADSLLTPPAEWQVLADVASPGGAHAHPVGFAGPARFFRLQISDTDTDVDGLTDWEERELGFNGASAHTERFDTLDATRAAASWNAASTVTVAAIKGTMTERWPEPGVFAVRRAGGLKPLVVSIVLSGSAVAGVDYAASDTTSVYFPPGAREAWVNLVPVADAADGEAMETITLTVQPGVGYSVGAGASAASVSLLNEPALGGPSAPAAVRFLIQAAFGPDKDDPADADLIPENAEQVMALGFEGWIDAQFALPPTYLQPFTEYAATIPEFYTDRKQAAWWSRAMGASPAVPGGPAVQYDVLRQRVAYCLSQILVVSDRPEVLAVQPVALTNYYDTLVRHSFGNYGDLLYDVTRHPVMGFYLSALKNQKPDPVNHLFPDENYAREIMQLFTIGLWELEPDGTRRLSDGTDLDPAGNAVPAGLPIPSYDNTTITNFARVFTGMTYADGASFAFASENWLEPMAMWDAFHDLAPKTLLNGVTLPARVASLGTTGTATDADVQAAMDNLVNHPNTGPFLARQLIQRLVTSNPSPAYVGRVAAAFADADPGPAVGERGDLKAVIKAILLDPEARDPARRADPHFGKQREPFLRVVNLARAFNASSPSGFYSLSQFHLDHYQEPLNSPSVFNFYLPNYAAPGEVQAAGLVSPEFQIVNATSTISAPNYYHTAILSGLHRWGTADPTRNVTLDLAHELTLVGAADLDTLLRRLDFGLTGGALSPRQLQIIREAVLRIGTGTWDWERERLRLALWLIVTSPEYCVLR